MQNRTGFSRQTAYARFYRQAVAETGPTGQLHYDSMANGGHLFRPEDKDELDFSEPAMLFYARVNHLNDTEYNHSLPPYSSTLIHVSSHTSLRVSSALRASARMKLRSPGERPEFMFPTGLFFCTCLLFESIFQVNFLRI